MAIIKNPTPKNIALLAAGLSSVVPVMALIIAGVDLVFSIVIIVVYFISTYVIFNSLLEKFIYRNIKVIYKNIHQLKTKDFNVSNKKDPIKEVSDEVFAWAREKRDEIQTLKRQENFRREFLGNVSHELKTPIFNIQGYIHTLLDGALEDKDVNRKFLTRAAKSTERLSELVQDISTISKIESGQLEMEPSSFDIVELTEEVFEGVELKARERKISLEIKGEGKRSFNVLADRSRIKQVLTNLITNGIKYGNEKGYVQVGFYDMDKNVLIEVSDNGEGISEEHLTRLFERFYRVDKSRSREAGGSGLGLAIVKHIIEAHNQTINVRSSLGKGTTFGFTLLKSKD